MKTLLLFTRNVGIWKAIAFLAAVFLLVGCGPHAPTVETVKVDKFTEGMGFMRFVNYPPFFVIDVDSTPYFKAHGRVVSDGGAEIIDMGICMSKHALPTVNDIKKSFHDSELVYATTGHHRESVSGSASLFKIEFYKLEKHTSYYFRAYAQNSAGISYGEVIEVNTFYTPIVNTVGAQAFNRTEGVIKGSIAPQNLEAEVWFEIWREGEAVRRIDVPGVSGDKAVAVSTHVSGLTAGETYLYTVKAKNAAGTVAGETKTLVLLYDQVSDYDGNKYWTVKIGDQIWLAENLRTKHFLNGDPIPNVQPDAEWVGMRSPAWCYYNNDPKLGEVYGCLYNNYVGLDPRGLIAGYHTPSIQEYETLVGYLGGGTIAPRKLKSATDDWANLGKGDNSSGFNALPGGGRWNNGVFTSWSATAVFSTSTIMEGVGAYYDAFVYTSNREVMTAGASTKDLGRSIRLIKN